MRVLVPIEIMEGESVSPGLIDLLAPVEVVLLGYHVLPDQTPPDQARFQYEDRAMSALEDIAEGFNGSVETRLVFTHDREKSIQRIAEEVAAEAYVIGGAAGSIERLLISLTGDIQVENVVNFVIKLIGPRDIGVTLFLADSDKDDTSERIDDSAKRLRRSGITTGTKHVHNESAFTALINTVPGHDAVIMGEKAPSLVSFLFGDESERVAAESVGPVVVVRQLNITENTVS